MMFPKQYFVNRAVGDYDENGIWQFNTILPVSFLGSVQPADSNTIEAIPEGRENNGALMIFSDTRLQTSLQDSQSAGDHLSYFGLDYEIIQESVFDSGLLPHYKYTAVARGPI
jgi:hypothetical protein